MTRQAKRKTAEREAVWEPSPDHEPRPDQLSIFDPGEYPPEPAPTGKPKRPATPSLFDPEGE